MNSDKDFIEDYGEDKDLELEEESLIEDEDDSPGYIKMDYSLETPEERNEKVKEIIAATNPEKLTPRYLEKLADYIIFAMNKQEKRNKKILTDNRMVTVNKNETSFEGLVGKLENGEDGIYNMITNDKNIIRSPKVSITEQDLIDIPALRELKAAIDIVEKQCKKATGKKAYLLKKQLIDMRKDQYAIKNSVKQPMYCTNLVKSMPKFDLTEKITIDETGNIVSTGIINFFNEDHISILLCNYSKIKEDCWSNFNGDTKWMMIDFENLVDRALKEKYPLYYDLIIYKIDGKQNLEIQNLINQKYHIKHSVEYISSLWRNKIPKLIVEQAKKEWLIYHFTFEEEGKWKKCSRCGQIKLAHNMFFSINKTSKDGYYSICKACRNNKREII